MSADNVIPLGPLEKRASRTISNAALYDLVQDVARAVDSHNARFDQIDSRLEQILEKLHAR